MDKCVGCNAEDKSMEGSRTSRIPLLMHKEIYYEIKVGNGVRVQAGPGFSYEAEPRHKLISALSVAARAGFPPAGFPRHVTVNNSSNLFLPSPIGTQKFLPLTF